MLESTNQINNLRLVQIPYPVLFTIVSILKYGNIRNRN